MKQKKAKQLVNFKPGKTMTLLPGMHKWGKELGLGLRGDVQNFDLEAQHSIKQNSQSTAESMKLKLRRWARASLKYSHYILLIIMTRNLQFMTTANLSLSKSLHWFNTLPPEQRKLLKKSLEIYFYFSMKPTNFYKIYSFKMC